MESSRAQLSKMESSRADLSKMETLLSLTNSGYTADEIIHFACDCYLCVNDVKPIRPPEQPRQTHSSQVNIQPPQAMLFLLKKCVNYRGFFNIPQIISLQQGMLFYSSDWGKLRTRDKVTNQQAKKFFDDRKQKVRFSSKNLQKQRQSYVLVYKAGSQQVLNDAHYTKIINKRKNDPFWLEVSYSYRMPESRQVQPPLKNFTYVRTKSVGSRMKLIMEKVMNQVDSYQSKGFRDKQQGLNNASMMTLPQNMQNSMLNNSFAGKNVSQQFNRMGNSLSESLVDVPGISGIYKTQKSKFKGLVSIKMMMEEIIAFMQVSSKTRVLELQVEYTQVEGDPIILGIKKLTICDVPFQQQCYLHDRFKPIDHIGQKQLIELKKMYDCKDQQTLWNVCGQILESCLQQRRIKLKIQNYKKPQKAELKQIYQKFFPDFSVEEMFQNVNWKNQLSDFMLKSKIKINKMIQSDQGISILKRFGVVFFRTF